MFIELISTTMDSFPFADALLLSNYISLGVNFLDS